MSYNKKYYHQYYDIGNLFHKIEILEKDYSGDEELITHSTGDPVFLSHKGNKDDFENTVLQGQELRFSFYCKKEDFDKYDDLFTANYKDIKVKYYIQESDVFEGYLKPESLSKQLFREAYVISFSATDAIADLREIEFRDSDDKIINDKMPILEVVKYAIDVLDIEQDFLIQLGTYEKDYMTSSQCALDKIQIDTRRFIDQEKGKLTVFSCWDVIRDSLKDFNVKFKQHNGKYTITNHHELDSYKFLFDYSGLSEQSRTVTDNIVDISTGYRFDYMAEEQKIRPLKSIGITFNNKDLGGDVTSRDLSDWDSNWTIDFYAYSATGGIVQLESLSSEHPETNENSITLAADFNVTKITDNDYIKLEFDHLLSSYLGSGIPSVKLKIQVTRPDETVVLSNVYPSCYGEWSHFESNLNNAFIITESGDYNVKITFIPDPYNPTWYWDDESPVIYFKVKDVAITKIVNVLEEDDPDTVTYDKYYIQNTDKGFEKLETTIILADTLQTTEVGALLYDDSGTWRNTGSWNSYGQTENIKLLDIYARNILNNRYDYKSYLNLKIYDPENTIGFNNILKLNDKYYTFLSYERNMKKGIITCELVELLTTRQSYATLIEQSLSSVDGKEVQGSQNVNYTSPSNIPSHNQMGGLYGDSDYYHLSQAKYNNVGNLDSMAYEATTSYYTKTDLTGGALDSRYYTETEVKTWRNSVTQTEMGHLHGVTSDVQTQITARAVISGAPNNNEIAIWTGATDIEGDSRLTFDGSELVNKANLYKQYSNEADKTDHRLTLYTADADLARIYNYDEGESAYRNVRLGSDHIYIDEVNSRVGIFDSTPSYTLDVDGTGRFTGNFFLDANIGTDNYVSETTGWQGNYAGQWDVRRLFADELIVKTFIADIDLALLSGHMVSKSVTQLSRDFTVPANTYIGTLYVEALPGHPTSQVFQDNDWIRLQIVDRTGGGLIWVEVWGTVTNFVDDGDGEQHYTFTTRDDGGSSGSVVHAGAAAQDLGQSGDGYILQDAGYGTYRPYLQVATWVTDPSVGGNHTVRSRLGNLGGITGQSGYGLVTRKDNDNYVTQWWNSDSDWGIKGAVGGNVMFQLGDTNEIAGWTIESAYFAKDTGTDATSAGMSPVDYPFYAGAIYANRATAPFRVTPAGEMTAKLGVIGKWNINSTSIYTGTEDHSGYTANAGDITIYSDGSDASIHAYYFYIDNAGKIYTKAGEIAGWTIDTDAIYMGTKKTTDGYASSGVTFASNGSIHTENWYLNVDGDVGLRQIEEAIFKQDGDYFGIKISGGQIWENEYEGNGSSIVINNKGYNGGTSYYRDCLIKDGKGNAIVGFYGDGKLIQSYGEHLFDGGIRTIPVFNTSSTHTLTIDETILISTYSGTATIYLPASPQDGEIHIIKRESINNLTVDGNGNNIYTIDEYSSTTIGVDGGSVIIVFDDTNDLWHVIGAHRYPS